MLNLNHTILNVVNHSLKPLKPILRFSFLKAIPMNSDYGMALSGLNN
jgi:hypothetical protein